MAEFITGRPAGSNRAPLDVMPETAYCDATETAELDPAASHSWNGWGVGLDNTRFQSAEAAGLTVDDVPRLRLKWAFGIPGVAASGSQATVVGGRIFVGSRNGMVYALDAQTGCIAWVFEADAAVRSTPTVVRVADGGTVVFFGDAHAQVYALDAAAASLKWKIKAEEYLDAMITGATAFHDGRLYVHVSSLEEGSAVIPSYECCTFRGSVLAIDADTGREIWRIHTIPTEAERTTTNSIGTQVWGPSGAAVWSAPTLDPERNRLFVTTGDSYSNPAAPTSDAVMALAMDTGRILWVQQTLPGDAWNVSCMVVIAEDQVNCPDSEGPDYDFGSSAALTMLEDDESVLLAGQKSGVLYALSPEDGQIMWNTRVGNGGVLGGIE